MKFSSFLSLNLHDLIRGAIMAAGGAAFGIIEAALNAGSFQIDWSNVWHMAVGTAVVYLGKNFLTPMPTSITIDPNITQVIEKTQN